MSLKPVYQNLYQLIRSMELAMEQKFVTPTLILLYSGIDIVTSLNTEVGKNVTRNDFIEWANKYMIPHLSASSLKGEDLYAARCAVVHTMAAESDLSRQGKASQVLYTFGNKEENELQDIITSLKMDHKVIKVEVLIKAFRLGIVDFFDDIEKDENLQQRFFERSRVILSYTDMNYLDEFNSLNR